MKALIRVGTAFVAALGSCSAAAQEPARTVEIIGTSPLPGQGVDRGTLPYSTQLLRRPQIDDAQAANLTELLARRLGAVQVSEIQGSPFQGELSFRGFRASGLVGAAQGMSVYLDGVRINEPFGDVIQWDLVPEFALDSVALVPGANPAFGLNTLGGAIVLTTATGRTAPGLRAEAGFGSFGRKRLDLSHGSAQADWHGYLALSLFDESGWRDHSAGHLGSALAKVGRTTESGDFTLSLLAARSRLVGNGLVPLYTLQADGTRTPDLGAARRQAVYTYPDSTRNRLAQAGLAWRRALDAQSTIEALAYVRTSKREAVNGDAAQDAQAAANAALNRSATRQSGNGLSIAGSGRHAGHSWQVGASLDRAGVHYEQTEQAAAIDAGRGVTALDEVPMPSAAVAGRSMNLGLYATDTWRLAAGTHLTGTLRSNQASLSHSLASVDDGELRVHAPESFHYRSLNPALGLAQRLGGAVTAFANAARNARVPTVIELGCADPTQPCRLPAGLQSDPYLKQVRSTSFEAGLRLGSNPADGATGSLTAYRTGNRDDILFRSISLTGQLGFFQNFERTRHQGLDAEWRWHVRGVDMTLNYNRLDATYQADGALRMGQRNVVVRPGTRIAGLPRHSLKASVDAPALPGLLLGADVQALSRRTTTGNEDGRADNVGTDSVDLGLPGFAIASLRAAWRLPGSEGLELVARITNLLDRKSASWAAIAPTRFDASGVYTGIGRSAVFVAPGAPRAAFMGLRARF